jgi:hypothetical protein
MASTRRNALRVGAAGDTAAMTEDTWGSRRRLEDLGTYLTRATAVEGRTGLDHDTAERALRRLNSQPSFFEKVVEASGGQIIRWVLLAQTHSEWLVPGRRLSCFFNGLWVRWNRRR